MRHLPAFLLVLVCTAPALAAEDVTFTTKDGLKITGTWYPSGRKGAAGVVALPMYRHERSTYTPVAAGFTKAGIDFLAIDLRGHGDSAVQGEKDLSERVTSRDPELFNAMWQDALAAREFLIGKGVDPNRVGLLGASVGCSVAIDAAGREPRIPGVCVMTPGKNYLGVDTMADLEAYGKRPMLLLSSRQESTAALEIQGRLKGSEVGIYEERNVHGTKMFGKVRGVEERIVKWFDGLLAGSVALNGKLCEREISRYRAGTWQGEDGRTVVFYARPLGRWWHVAAVPAPNTSVPTELELALKSDDRGWSIRWKAGGDTFSQKILRDGKWAPVRVKAAPGPRPGAAQGGIVEMLIPVRRGLEPSPDLRIRVTAKTGDADVSSDWRPVPKVIPK